MQKEVIEKIAFSHNSRFGLIASSCMEHSNNEIFRLVFGDQSGIWAMLFYAVVVTIIAVVVTIWIGRVAEKHTGKKVRGTWCHPAEFVVLITKNELNSMP